MNNDKPLKYAAELFTLFIGLILMFCVIGVLNVAFFMFRNIPCEPVPMEPPTPPAIEQTVEEDLVAGRYHMRSRTKRFYHRARRTV